MSIGWLTARTGSAVPGEACGGCRASSPRVAISRSKDYAQSTGNSAKWLRVPSHVGASAVGAAHVATRFKRRIAYSCRRRASRPQRAHDRALDGAAVARLLARRYGLQLQLAPALKLGDCGVVLLLGLVVAAAAALAIQRNFGVEWIVEAGHRLLADNRSHR
jgi:hypothetical protein